MNNETALSLFRAFNGYPSQQEGYLPALIRQHLDDKEISIDTIRFMRSEQILVGSLIHSTLMRGRGDIKASEMDFIVKMIYNGNEDVSDLSLETYDGSAEQNKVIDRSLTLFNSNDLFVGESAMAQLLPPKNPISNASQDIKNIPIAVLGTGPAGVMVTAALRIAGFQKIRTFDKHGSALGIWGQPNVAGGTKNNPRQLDFGGLFGLAAARGDGNRDASAVVEFLRNISQRYDLYDGREKIGVTKVISDDLKHTVHYEEDKQTAFAEFPIVINCIGTGKPREFSDKKRMTLDKSAERPLAIRWQQRLERKDVQGKRFAFIGLGNSTAEMMSQLNEYRNAGVDCDYKIFTHYPEESVLNPNDTINDGDRNYRMFRDLSKPDLTGFQGDLPRARQDYMRALREDRIVADVTSWSVRKGGSNILVTNQDEYRYDKLFVLTGYQQDNKVLEDAFGLDCQNGYPAADYDGEFRKYGEIRKGYFGLGALMDSPHDPNAVVIPGMMFRMPDMIFTIICRAAEYIAAKRSKV